MTDLNWCTFCDNAIMNSDSLYCSETCLREDARNHHPLNGFAEFKDFPRSRKLNASISTSTAKSNMSKSSTQTSSIIVPSNQFYAKSAPQYSLLLNQAFGGIL
ncbi:hypothetical protein K501DRAFT_267534 [Backusella circina FSU 941]|nr:hypothetical protein K501DRAFT_267534 [Backusella circina FSU 941]